MSTELLRRWTVVQREEDDEDHCLWWLGKSIPVYIFHVFLDFRPLGGNDDTLAVNITLLVDLDAWAATVLRCLDRRKCLARIDKKFTWTLGQPM